MKRIIPILMLVSALLSACGLVQGDSVPTSPDVSAMQTQLADAISTATVQAQIHGLETQIAAVNASPTAMPILPATTSIPTQMPTNTPVLDNALKHLAYWTTQTEADRWPNLEDFDIVICHGDPNQQGNATAVILVKGSRPIAESDLSLIYFNGYSGEYSLQNHNQIVTEVQDSVRPHVPGFTLTNVTVIFLP